MFWELHAREVSFDEGYDPVEWTLRTWKNRPDRQQVLEEVSSWDYALKNEDALFSLGKSGVFTDDGSLVEISLNFYATWDENPFND